MRGKETSESIPIPARAAPAKHLNHGSFEYPLRRRFFVISDGTTIKNFSTAQDHKITATGFTTITSSGSGTEGESHTIRIVNSGIATVGFSTYFLFPSGAAPTMPTADGAVSLISFTVHDSVGAGCTQLLAGASVNFS